jgi:hypothetical protein
MSPQAVRPPHGPGDGRAVRIAPWCRPCGIPIDNLLEQAINCEDGDRAAKIIQNALGIEGDDVASYWLPENLAN